ncbi:hypothetical protein [Desulfofundulus sp.]|uniref:hypothetical protein n=1 Tax=Desulfofundulus sp. TaxID=2282750 RepID=UPI003C748203
MCWWCGARERLITLVCPACGLRYYVTEDETERHCPDCNSKGTAQHAPGGWGALARAVNRFLVALDLAERTGATVRMTPKMWGAVEELRELAGGDREAEGSAD